ncbi:MAG: peptidylprolyl isomerase [Pseudomonadota bacterium]
MKNMRLSLISMALTVASGGSALAAVDDEAIASGEFLDGIVAVVNEGVVLRSELDAQTEIILQRLRADGVELPPPEILEDQILERLIINRLQLQRVERIGIRIPDEMLNATIAQIARENNMDLNALPQQLAAQGIDYNAYRSDMREQLAMQQLRQIDVIGRISVSPREIDQCLDKQISQVNVNAEYNISHILVSVPENATQAQFDEAKAEAEAVIRDIENGTSFAEMAVSSSDAQTALEGGALGWRPGNQVPTLFAEVLATMGPGDVSEPIQNASGFHIVRLNDQRGAVLKSEVNQTKVRHILVQTNEVIDDQTAEQRLKDARQRILDGEDFAELARLISDDPGSVSEGGDMGWTEPGTFVDEFEAVADASEIGEVSQPFKSRFGWHILQVNDRRVYDNTEEMRERQCAMTIRNSRVEEETELWLRRLRDEAFVDKRI